MLDNPERLNDFVNSCYHEFALKDPITRAVAKAYCKVEFKRMEKPVYQPLEAKYPSLRITSKASEEGDPVYDMAEAEKFCIIAKRTVLGSKHMTEKIDSLQNLYEQVNAMQKEFYIGMARAAKEASSQQGLKPEDMVTNQEFVDSIWRKVFPTREEVETYCRKGEEFAFAATNFTRDLTAFLGIATGKIEEPITPTREALEGLAAAMSKYRAREFDRIYGLRI